MTLPDAFAQFLDSTDFAEVAQRRDNTGTKYRTYRSRFNKGELKAGAMVEMLQAHGYEIKANKVSKKKK